MRHLKSGRKLGRTNSHKRAMMRNLVMSLFEYKKVSTTLAKAKELRPYAETLITRAKKALQKEQAGLLGEGQTVDIHSRRVVGRDISKKAILQELFDSIAPVVLERNGGYCRIIKTGTRRGDAAETAIIELVDWSAPLDGSTSIKPKKKVAKKVKSNEVKSAVPAPIKEIQVEEVVNAVSEVEVTDKVEEEVSDVATITEVAEVTEEVEATEVTQVSEEISTEVVTEPVTNEVNSENTNEISSNDENIENIENKEDKA